MEKDALLKRKVFQNTAGDGGSIICFWGKKEKEKEMFTQEFCVYCRKIRKPELLM